MVTAVLTFHHLLASGTRLVQWWMPAAVVLLIGLCLVPVLVKFKMHFGPPILALVSLLAGIAAACCNPPFYRPTSDELLAKELAAVVAIITFLVVLRSRDLTWIWLWRIFRVVLIGGCARVWLLHRTAARDMASFGLFLVAALGFYISIWMWGKLRAVEPASTDGCKSHELHRNDQISDGELDRMQARLISADPRQNTAA